MEVGFSLESQFLSRTSIPQTTRTPPRRALAASSARFPRSSLNIITSFTTAPLVGGSLSGDFAGQKFRPPSLRHPSPGHRGKRGVVTMGGEKLGYETEAFAIYDVMRYVKPPIFTLCVGNAWGEAALLLAAGAQGNRAALPSSTIMIKEPIARFQGQATDVELARKEIKNVKSELVSLYSRHIGKSEEQIAEDIRRPKYFSPKEAFEYGIIDKVLYNERGREDRSVVSDLKRAQLI